MTVLFSATQTKNVEDLARISLKKAPLYVGVDDHKETATVEGLEQVGLMSSYYLKGCKFVLDSSKPRTVRVVFSGGQVGNILS